MGTTVFLEAEKQLANIHLCCNKNTLNKPASKMCQRLIIFDPHFWLQCVLAKEAWGQQGPSRLRAESCFIEVFLGEANRSL